MEPTTQGGGGKPSKVESLKTASEYLKTFVADEIRNEATHLTEDAATILKFHGSYQQDDRDQRTRLKKAKLEKAFQFMVRVRMVGGRMTAKQFLTCDELARTLGNGTLRITTRQEFQFYGVLKQDLPAIMRQINEALMCTLAACGDVERNVLCCSAPIHDKLHDELNTDAQIWAAHCAPRASSYWDIWLDGEKIQTLPPAGPSLVPTSNDDPVEPIYGPTYLPRKFKSAFAFPEDNCTDLLANDLGFLAVVENGNLVGYNVYVGGGLGTTPSAQKTFPYLGKLLCFVERERFREVGEAVIKVFRDFGNRSDRKRARLKYIIHGWGMPAFRSKIEEYLGHPVHDPKPVELTDVDDHLGWNEQGDGKLFLGIPIQNGRLKDDGSLRILSGLRTYFEKYQTPGRLTCQQKLILMDIEPRDKAAIEALLEEYGIATVEQVSTVRRWSMACPALPTCGLAVTEAERALPGIIDRLEQELDKLGLGDERFTVRMTGCPNGCARPYNSDIGLVGRSALMNPDGTPGPGNYTLFLGGRTLGDRLNVLFKDYVPYDKVVDELLVVFLRFKEERYPSESFGDFCDRIGVEELAKTNVEAAQLDPS